MTFLDWNDLLTEHFFSPEKAGQKVCLFATQELIEGLGQPRNTSFSDFIQAVKVGPTWAHRTGFCQRALEAMLDWREKGLKYPPYVAFLALFVIAAGLEGDFAGNAFYPRLRTLLGEEPDTGALPSFDRMLQLWDDLERWSNVDKKGDLGIFEVRVFGGWIHRGVPVAQTLLSEQERHALPVIFARAGLDAAAPPSDLELPVILSTYGRHELKARTLSLLRNRAEADAETRQALTEAVLDELREWDGLTPDMEAAAGADDYISGALRLCCQLDTTAGTSRMLLRCKTSADFPEEGLSLCIAKHRALINNESAVLSEALVAEEWGLGWSTALKDELGGLINAAWFDWRSDLVLEDPGRGWKFRMRPSAVRILADGRGEGIDGLVEVRRIPAASEFYVLVHPDDCQAVEQWGASSCDGWKEIRISNGLPVGWRLFVAVRARSDELIREKYPLLSLPTHISVSLRGGIRVSRGNRYFDFAPPSVEAIGASVDRVVFNHTAIAIPNAKGYYDFPKQLQPLADGEHDKILIEAQQAGKTVARMSVFLAREGWPWVGVNSGLKLGPFGEVTNTDEEMFAWGAIVHAFQPPEFDFSGTVPLAEQGAIYYLGREPGQIAHLPYETLPKTWSPVWVIISRRKGRAVFCGNDIATSQPRGGICTDRRKLKKWREFLWVRRKELTPPSHRTLQSLWRKYQRMARDV